MVQSDFLKTLEPRHLRSQVGLLVGTRPGIIMLSALIRTLLQRRLNFFIIHAGQHYSPAMDRKLFDDLRLPLPRHHLRDVKRYRSHGRQTARMLEGIEKVLTEEKPKILLVGGDANCNLAGALAARKLHIKVGHIEAGERSYDWRMPEEHNRVVIDHISDYLFATNAKSRRNLEREGVRGRICVTGNPIVDAVRQNRDIAAQRSSILSRLGLKNKDYFILTTHREENVDVKAHLGGIFDGIGKVYMRFDKPVIFCAHPRTLDRMKKFGLTKKVKKIRQLRIVSAVGYLDFITLLSHALLVFTDSGGVQQESYIFRVPCVTLRNSTEWTETVKGKANILVGTDPHRIVKGVATMLKRKISWGKDFGTGNSSNKMATILKRELEKSR